MEATPEVDIPTVVLDLTGEEHEEQAWQDLVLEVNQQIVAMGSSKEEMSYSQLGKCLSAAHAKLAPVSVEDKNLLARHKKKLRALWRKEAQEKAKLNPLKSAPVITEVYTAMNPAPVLQTVEIRYEKEEESVPAPVVIEEPKKKTVTFKKRKAEPAPLQLSQREFDALPKPVPIIVKEEEKEKAYEEIESADEEEDVPERFVEVQIPLKSVVQNSILQDIRHESELGLAFMDGFLIGMGFTLAIGSLMVVGLTLFHSITSVPAVVGI